MSEQAPTPAPTDGTPPADPYTQFTGTRPVAPQHAFDVAQLTAYLHAHMPALAAGPLQVEQF